MVKLEQKLQEAMKQASESDGFKKKQSLIRVAGIQMEFVRATSPNEPSGKKARQDTVFSMIAAGEIRRTRKILEELMISGNIHPDTIHQIRDVLDKQTT